MFGRRAGVHHLRAFECDGRSSGARFREAAWRGGAAAELADGESLTAHGAGLPVSEARGSMVVDIGGGTTEVGMRFATVASLIKRPYASAATSSTRRSPPPVRRNYNLLIGEGTAERVKLEIGSAVSGRATASG